MSSLLYDDTQRESLMQSIIDQLSTPASFSQAIKDFLNAASRAGKSSSYLLCLQQDFDFLSKIGIGNDVQQANPMCPDQTRTPGNDRIQWISGEFWKQYSNRNFLGFFPMIFDQFLPTSTGSWQESIGKNPKNFRSEY
jgi:hypothetical protein